MRKGQQSGGTRKEAGKTEDRGRDGNLPHGRWGGNLFPKSGYSASEGPTSETPGTGTRPRRSKSGTEAPTPSTKDWNALGGDSEKKVQKPRSASFSEGFPSVTPLPASTLEQIQKKKRSGKRRRQNTQTGKKKIGDTKNSFFFSNYFP
jgi:hypothetical protein